MNLRWKEDWIAIRLLLAIVVVLVWQGGKWAGLW